METTLNKIKKYKPCEDGWKTLLESLNKTKADDQPLSIEHIIQSNGIRDAIWCLRAVDRHEKEIKLFAVWCAKQVQHLMEDKRSIKALDIAEKFINGEANEEDMSKDCNAASYACSDAAFADYTAHAVAFVAFTAARAAYGTHAAYDSVDVASCGAYVASDAYADDAAYESMREKQKDKLLEIINKKKGGRCWN